MPGPDESPDTDVAPSQPMPPTPAPPSFGLSGSIQPGPSGPPAAPEQPAEPAPRQTPSSPWWAVQAAEDPAEPEETAPAPAEEQAEMARTTPVVMSFAPGTLVAGPGVPSIDTRRAVPPEPLKEAPSLGFPDTFPDGIPVTPPASADPAEEPPDQPADAPLTPDAILPPGTVSGSTAAAAPPAGKPARDVPAASPAQPTPATEPIWPSPSEGPPQTAKPTPPPPPPRPPSPPRQPPMSAPPGSAPPSGHSPGQPPGQASGRPTSVIAPAYHAYGRVPPIDNPPPPRVSTPGSGGRRRLLLVGAGGLAAIVVAGVAVIGLGGPSDSKPAANSAQPSQPAAPQPSPPPSTPRAAAAPSIDNEKTDRQPLRLSDVFPARPLALGGRTYKQDKTSVNHQCSLVARGAMAAALVRGRCRSVVRATYVDSRKRLAVTAGVVAMPTRKIALAVRRSGDPSEYEWFRGMAGTVAKDIDQAGGFAASTVRGRFIIYSYTTYLNGHPATNDPLLAKVGKQFVAYAVRPIERRAH